MARISMAAREKDAELLCIVAELAICDTRGRALEGGSPFLRSPDQFRSFVGAAHRLLRLSNSAVQQAGDQEVGMPALKTSITKDFSVWRAARQRTTIAE
jgi:hypothetical protein